MKEKRITLHKENASTNNKNAFNFLNIKLEITFLVAFI